MGTFIIFNTFSMAVGQRVREFAMLRALGAARRQVMTAVVLEALLDRPSRLGVVGIAPAALLVAAGMGSIFRGVGQRLPEAGAALSANAVIIRAHPSWARARGVDPPRAAPGTACARAPSYSRRLHRPLVNGDRGVLTLGKVRR